MTELTQRAENIVKTAAAEGTGDFVEQVSCELPLQVIAGLLGVPQDERAKLFRWTNEMTGNEDPEFAHVDGRASSMEVLGYAMQMAGIKAENPGDDIVTALINADIDGEKLADEEFAFFVLMLAVAGSETTRNSITHGMIAFLNNPDQWELYKRERPATAADEIVRWATPVTAFQRTAIADTELGGVKIKAGQRVVMFYRSANFDEEVFDRPHKFNILRDPNPHVGFGGTGVHYCIGANLARMTIDLMFNAIADNMPDLTSIGTPERLRSGWLNGIKHWQVDYTGNSLVLKRPDGLRLTASSRLSPMSSTRCWIAEHLGGIGLRRRDAPWACPTASAATGSGCRRSRGADRGRAPRASRPALATLGLRVWCPWWTWPPMPSRTGSSTVSPRAPS